MKFKWNNFNQFGAPIKRNEQRLAFNQRVI